MHCNMSNVFGPCYAACDQDISDNDNNHNLLLHLYSCLAYVGAVFHPGFFGAVSKHDDQQFD